MGEAADSAYESAEYESEVAYWLRRSCKSKEPQKGCDWSINYDGLFECKKCGEVTDI